MNEEICWITNKGKSAKNEWKNDSDFLQALYSVYKKIRNNFFPYLLAKGALLGPRQFLATESPLKMMKNVFYFTLKALFILKIFKFLSRRFGHV